jgi:hypothetical protein
MADAAELTFQYPRHGKMFCGFLFNVENIGMAIIAVEPPRMLLVREYCGRDTGPFRIQQEWLHNRNISRRFNGHIMDWRDKAVFHGLHPA